MDSSNKKGKDTLKKKGISSSSKKINKFKPNNPIHLKHNPEKPYVRVKKSKKEAKLAKITNKINEQEKFSGLYHKAQALYTQSVFI